MHSKETASVGRENSFVVVKRDLIVALSACWYHFEARIKLITFPSATYLLFLSRPLFDDVTELMDRDLRLLLEQQEKEREDRKFN